MAWRPFMADARRFRQNCALFLRDVGETGRERQRRGISEGPKTGRHWPDLPNRSSAPGEYPANQTGRLRRSIRFSTSRNAVSFGSTLAYGMELAYGKSRVAPRQMSKETLKNMGGEIRRLFAHRQPFIRFLHTYWTGK